MGGCGEGVTGEIARNHKQKQFSRLTASLGSSQGSQLVPVAEVGRSYTLYTHTHMRCTSLQRSSKAEINEILD